MNKFNSEKFSKKVREKREFHKVTLRQLSKAIGLSPSTILRIENGHIPDIETFGKICSFLELKPGKFFNMTKYYIIRKNSQNNEE